MPRAPHDRIELEYVTDGDAGDPPLLLINGVGDQLIHWDRELVDAFVDRGFFVIRFDNRDMGLSSRTEEEVDVGAALVRIMAGDQPPVPYTLDDMADDAVAVLDALGIGRAHVLGVSLGGAIAQFVAIRHPDRVASLVSVSSSTGDPDVGQARDDVYGHLLTPPDAEGREGAIEWSLSTNRLIGSPDHFEEDRIRARAGTAWDRGQDLKGVAVQILAAAASPSRTEALRALDVPALVVHGDRDPMVDVSGGRRTAEVVTGAELLILEGMGHDLPTFFWPVVVESVTKLAARAGDAG
jgi:pimeloyl-ACP methyl ester carboxylesterase